MSPNKRALLVLLCALLVPIVPFVVIGEMPGERWLMSSGGDGVSFGATGAGLLALDLLLPVRALVSLVHCWAVGWASGLVLAGRFSVSSSDRIPDLA